MIGKNEVGVSVDLNQLCLSCVLLERIIVFNLVFGAERAATGFGMIMGSLGRLIKDTYLGQGRIWSCVRC